MATRVFGQLLNLPGTCRKHEVALVSASWTQAPVPVAARKAVGCTIDTSGNYRIISTRVAGGWYKLLIDRIWLSVETIEVTAGVDNTGKNCTLQTPPVLPPASPYPVNTDNTIVTGWCTDSTAVDRVVALYVLGDENANPKTGKTKTGGYYRITGVEHGLMYDVTIEDEFAGNVSVSNVYDVERHDLEPLASFAAPGFAEEGL